MQPLSSVMWRHINLPSSLPSFPAPHSTEEIEAFAALQSRLTGIFRDVFPNPRAPRTIVVIPSLSFDQQELAKISGVHHYEERMLCMLMLLRLPCTRLIYVTSQPISPTVVDYFLSLLPGIPGNHARSRLVLLSCHDASPIPLTQKLLDRPRLLVRLRDLVRDSANNHMVCFNATALERTLAVRLGLPLYACDPALLYLGTKSGSRQIFREAGVLLPDGEEDLRDEADVVRALARIKRREPGLRRAVVKLNDGFSGEGNALFTYGDVDAQSEELEKQIQQRLSSVLRFEAKGETWPRFARKFEEMGGVVESFVEGETKRSPSVQCRINPLGEINVISTHDQILGGPSGQVFLGCTFPADGDYRLEIQEAGQKVSEVLRSRGALGRFSIDFISVPREQGGWDHYAIEINLRKGGTTHPFMTLQFLTDGNYDLSTGLYLTPSGQPRYYYASDNLEHAAYRGLRPEDLIDIAVYNNLHFHGASQQGVAFHLIGALSEFGKVGVLCIGETPQAARQFYDATVDVLDRETQNIRKEGESPLVSPIAHRLVAED
jgi:hypothetical protein